ncbi:Protein kinase-like (PK-like) [Glarea lozoyensis ATCC 20868]|uniref:Protein kinase-like (PK-like) n=1 Tax=Glarea lozoyensis (strain ATCC 20868 / MF5171) TaxID=1116229 RepID=S3DS63_GLAL2|nr:Protein kinase-like (PK-like) [Glarea lozoyensis ATCC 20868]EPE34776.1 Protein kinase-like (PK-like) [Glarea lozoyensis ATCC 20868]
MSSDQPHPVVTSLRDLTIIEAWDTKTNSPKYVTFYYITQDERVYFGQSSKNKRDITLDEFSAALEPVRDDELYPEVPTTISLTIAPAELDDHTAFVKRPGLVFYEEMKGTSYIPNNLLDETIIMETISHSPHPNIVKYYGCRVQRGRITAILLEKLQWTLTQYVSTPGFHQVDKIQFAAELQSAVDFLHSLGLAHNDISPDNIMIKDGLPILIDFGSCQPFGRNLQSLGTPGWCKETFFTSEKEHDAYSMDKLRTWLQESK